MPPPNIQQAHEVNPGSEMDVDWTLAPGNGTKEYALRELRNALIQEQLESGKTASYRQSGWSCYPIISSNGLCHYEPVHHDWRKIGDIIFCAVEPGLR